MLARYERALAAAQTYDDPALVALEGELRQRLLVTPENDQAPIAAAVRSIEISVLGWATPTDRTDESAGELRSLGFSEAAITESRRLL